MTVLERGHPDVGFVKESMPETDTVLRGCPPMDRPPTQKVSPAEALLLCGAVLSLVVACVLCSLHKQAWMDEVFTWRELSDPSLWHLYYAVQHGADGGMPLFYTTAWLWAKAFGTGVLTLRLYSCVAMCAALVVTWRTLRRFYGTWATAFGVLTFWGTSGLLLDENAEARFYGLFLLTVAVALNIYTRLNAEPVPKLRLLILSLLSQAALVCSHVLGIIYGGLMLLGLILSDGARRRFRPRTYLFHAAGWLAMLVWLPSIRASMAVGKPHGWIGKPQLKYLFPAYLFAPFEQWFLLLERHAGDARWKMVHHMVEFPMLVALAVILLLGLRRLLAAEQRTSPDKKSALLLVGYLLLSAPVILFVASYLITPVFIARYMLPSGIGLAIVLADFADARGADRPTSSRLAWAGVAMFLAILPMLSSLAMPPLSSSWQYLDVQRLDHSVPANIAVVTDWAGDFAKVMRYSPSPQDHYYFLLDWPATLAGPKPDVTSYHLLSSNRDAGYYSRSVQESDAFLCSHTDFFVLHSQLIGQDADGPTWFDQRIREAPEFAWRMLGSFDAPYFPEVKRELIAVHRTEALGFCKKP
ncbi:MAG: glycosyltransferase family 39 protein [Acidobacteriaceae bacterium]